MTRSMLDFAKTDYQLIQNIKDIKGMEDPTLVNCQQCAEKYLKHLVRIHCSEVMRTHNLPAMIAKLGDKFPNLRHFKPIARFLTDSYFDRRYESEEYVELEDDEYHGYLEQSLNFIDYLNEISEDEPLHKN